MVLFFSANPPRLEENKRTALADCVAESRQRQDNNQFRANLKSSVGGLRKKKEEGKTKLNCCG